jgi:hypothetical protein
MWIKTTNFYISYPFSLIVLRPNSDSLNWILRLQVFMAFRGCNKRAIYPPLRSKDFSNFLFLNLDWYLYIWNKLFRICTLEDPWIKRRKLKIICLINLDLVLKYFFICRSISLRVVVRLVVKSLTMFSPCFPVANPTENATMNSVNNSFEKWNLKHARNSRSYEFYEEIASGSI